MLKFFILTTFFFNIYKLINIKVNIKIISLQLYESLIEL